MSKEKPKVDVMGPWHPRWREFRERLEGPEGCDFLEDEQGEITWRCGGGHDQSLSRAILEAMGGLDVAQSLAVFAAEGGHCDCEVLFNVGEDGCRWFPDDPTAEDVRDGLAAYAAWLEDVLKERKDARK